MPNYLLYTPSVETIEPDERETQQKIVDVMRDGMKKTRENLGGHSVRISEDAMAKWSEYLTPYQVGFRCHGRRDAGERKPGPWVAGHDDDDAPAHMEPTVDFPYGFPTAGRYRIFIQMKHGATVETGVFDAMVQ